MSTPTGIGYILEQVIARLSGVTCFIGEENLGRNGAPPRVVFIPGRDKLAKGASMTGTAAGRLQLPRILGTRTAGVVAHVWAKGNGRTSFAEITETEVLANRVVSACEDIAGGALVLGDGEWVTGEKIAMFGRGYLLDLGFLIPLTKVDPTTTTAVVTAFGMEGTADFPEPAVDVTRDPAP